MTARRKPVPLPGGYAELARIWQARAARCGVCKGTGRVRACPPCLTIRCPAPECPRVTCEDCGGSGVAQ